MNSYVRIYVPCLYYEIHLQQTHCLLSDIREEKVHRMMNIKDVFLECIITVARLDDD